MTCIARASFAEVAGTPETLDLTWRVMKEVEAVGRARGVAMAGDLAPRTVARMEAFKSSFTSSILTDLQRGNRIEVGVLNGAVAVYGTELGVAAPLNGFIAGCLAVSRDQALSRRP